MGLAYSFCFGDPPVGREATYAVSDEEPAKAYSWDKRGKTDPKQYMFDALEEVTIGKQPGEINGQQFVIQNCKKSNLYILDWTSSVTIDDCVDCSIVIGPCKGSVFIRDCSNCRFMIACQQFRTRDCKNMEIFIFCQTKPIIEESQQIRFACLQLHYEQLLAQFEAAEMSPFSNNWSGIHDFTPASGNYSLLPEDVNPMDYVPFEASEEFSLPLVSCKEEYSVIPLTRGSRGIETESGKTHTFLLAACGSPNGREALRIKCIRLIREIRAQNLGIVHRTWEVNLQPSDSERVIGNGSLKAYAKNGPAIAIEFVGANEIGDRCRELAAVEGWDKELHVVDPERTKEQLRIFITFIEMQLGV